MRKRIPAALAAVAVACGVMIAAPAAEAKSSWGPTQEVTSKLGWWLSVSDDGKVASWVRANRLDGQGPVRTAYYRGTKKGWTPSAEIAGTVGTNRVLMSTDGTYAVANVPGTGILVSERASKNSWGTAQTVASGQYLRLGQISADGSSIVYTDFINPMASPPVPAQVKLITRAADGTWNAPVVVGTMTDDAYYGPIADYMAISRDAGTIVWLDENWALRAMVKQADGTWGAPVLLKQFTTNPRLYELSLSKDGTRVIWSYYYAEEGIVTATRTGTTWSPLSYVTTDTVETFDMSPNGKVVAFATEDDEMLVKSWDGSAWSRAKNLGTVTAWGTDLAVTNKTLAWTTGMNKSLRASVYAKGKWQSSVKLASKAMVPALNTNGKTVLWNSMGANKVYSRKR